MKTVNKSFVAKPGELSHEWFVVDATDQILGRLASKIARVLMGKHKPTYTAHVDTGDFVVVLNAQNIRVTGNKAEAIVYQSYSGYPGGQKNVLFKDMLAKHPERVLRESVRRMLPKSKLGLSMLTKLKLYACGEHPHQAQNPQPFK